MRVAEARFDWDEYSFELAFAELEKELTEVYRGIAVSTWKSVLDRSPQYSGRMVVSWTFKVGWPDTRDNSAAAPPPRTDGMPYRRGDRAAINIANALNKGEEKMIYGLGYRVFISNGVDHGEGAYAGMAEYDAVKLRFANQPGMPIALTTAMIQSRYGEGVSRAQAAQLRRLEI